MRLARPICRDGMTVSPRVFARQLRYISRSHHIVGMGEALEALSVRGPVRKPLAVITFDDGYRSVFEEARPQFQALGVPACCFVSTDFLGSDRRFSHDHNNPVRDFLDVMSWEEVAMLRSEGWDVGAHGASHARLADLGPEDLADELERPLAELRSRLRLDRVAMAYPFGGPTDITQDGLVRAQAAGYIACFADTGGDSHPGMTFFPLNRMEVGGDHPALAWRARVHGFEIGSLWRRLRGSPNGGRAR